MLGALWALVPVAALTGDDGTALAQPAPAALAPPAIPAPAAPTAPRPEPSPARPERTAPARPEPPPVAWRESLALGTPNAGRLVRGVRLPTEGRGFYTYNPATQAPPGGAERQWGTDQLVREVLWLGVWWQRTHPAQPRLGVGDLSRPEGGPFPGPGVGHARTRTGGTSTSACRGATAARPAPTREATTWP